MKVSVNGRLLRDDGTPVRFQPSPNHSGLLVEPTCLLMHCTEGRGLQNSADWLCSRQSKASAHVIIGRDADVVQLVPFNRIAWHAGESSWQGRGHVNRWSIGIELDSPGPLRETPRGWVTKWGEAVADVDVFIDDDGKGWHVYPNEQVLMAYEVCEAIVDAFPKIDSVLAHSEVAPGRKSDPGAAFPMVEFRSWLLTRGEG